jgi:hypothetical protein
LRSVGPGPAPLPASFTVTLDPRLVRDVTVTSVRLNGKEYRGDVRRVRTSRTATAYQTEWRTPVPLKDCDVLDVLFGASLLKPSGPLSTIKHPAVVLTTTGEDGLRRETGRGTLTRLDSVWESGPCR